MSKLCIGDFLLTLTFFDVEHNQCVLFSQWNLFADETLGFSSNVGKQLHGHVAGGYISPNTSNQQTVLSSEPLRANVGFRNLVVIVAVATGVGVTKQVSTTRGRKVVD